MHKTCRAAIVLLVAWGLSLPRACLGAPEKSGAPEQTVSAGPLQATLKLDRGTLNVAENLTATLSVKAPVGVRVSLPAEEKKLGGFSIVSTVDELLRTVPTESGEQQEFVRRYTLEPFLSGEYTLPPLEIRWKKGTSESGVARTAEVKVTVTSLLPKPAADRPAAPDPGTIRGEYTLPAEQSSRAMWVGVAIGFGSAVAAVGGLWLWSRRPQTADGIEHWLKNVEEVRRTDSVNAANPEALHKLAGALRGAFADRISPSAASAEANELVKTLQVRSDWGEADARRAGEVLGALDTARFSGSSMPASEFRAHVDAVLEMLKKLRSMPSPREVKR